MKNNISQQKITKRISVLKETNIFSETHEETLKIIAMSLTEYYAKKGEVIVHKGDIGDAMFIIEKGSVKVHDGDYIFSVLKVDQVFGEYYLIDSDVRSASVTALENTELMWINQDTFYFLMAKNINITRGILKASVNRLRQMNVIEEELASKNIKIKKQKDKLEKQRQQLTELNATKDKFFSIIAHDLRSPLSTIISFFDFLNSQLDDLDKEEMIGLIQNIHNSTNSLLKLLDNLLQWSSAQTGRIVCEPKKFDLAQVAKANIDFSRMNAERKKIKLFSEIKEKTFVFADENMITTVIRNLISNSLKFTKEEGSVSITAKDTGKFIEVSVIDTGVGIKKESIKKLFRIDVKHTTIGTFQEKGSGLGLILCKEFIENNGGKIRVESEPGKGTTIKFTLPKP